MENQEQKDGKEGGCCAKSKCCGCKGLAALVAAALVFTGGYFCGKHCAMKSCATPAPVAAPATK